MPRQQISRLESPSYEGHSLSMLRRIADILNAKVHLKLVPQTEKQVHTKVAEDTAPYGKSKKK